MSHGFLHALLAKIVVLEMIFDTPSRKVSASGRHLLTFEGLARGHEEVTDLTSHYRKPMQNRQQVSQLKHRAENSEQMGKEQLKKPTINHLFLHLQMPRGSKTPPRLRTRADHNRSPRTKA